MFTPKELAAFSEELSRRYRSGQRPFMDSPGLRAAYMATRFPATTAVIRRVFAELPSNSFSSFLDLGAGPGSGTFIAKEVFPHLNKISCFERDQELIQLGKEHSPEAAWKRGDLTQLTELEPHQLVLISYVLGELSAAAQSAVVEKAWKSAEEFLVLIEPGTPAGFARIREHRQWLIDQGASIAAPCPHEKRCPMAENDWCHFSVRLERHPLHRFAKGAILNYEDEKFSYCIASKEKICHEKLRILRHPHRRSGHVSFVLCTAEGVQNKTISKRDKEIYSEARKLEWGDLL